MKAISTSLAALFFSGLVAGTTHTDWEHIDRDECPTDASFTQACWEAVTPPFPICEAKTTAEWVTHALDSSTRCCGEDISECKCPVKDGAKFREKIGG
eukprot:CAMPEP_0172570106 /NCGR_PEP_ID=MMETSP1067-20121228/126209_1 /TAXON_ID=265564 ORGANISM="Thalassiosira punctigera, Strain Tpunct2005C2" /NCGR_SAMPLE_ID=MMETSP1067 /ASSEMBLY_ACC=CAM_ASM_000444 /LENGTH=97 /DNA_ID=CAMNT_0013362115 /DNA_START=69 /DNA_END=359 /DNA_ORIENTATION=-